jgi:hypothetical protein
MAFFIESRTREGGYGLAGPYPTSYKAQMIIDSSYEVEAEVKHYPTSNLARATRMWKEEKIKEKGFTIGSRKIKHPEEAVREEAIS